MVMRICLCFLLLQSVYVYAGNLKFIVAGHGYGSPYSKYPGLYPSFVRQFEYIKEDISPRFIALTGDVVKVSSKIYWEKVVNDLKILGVPWYISPGNHDNAKSIVYRDNVWQDPYFSFTLHKRLFLFLHTDYAGWTVDSTQREWIDTTISKNSHVSEIFVFTHHLWWVNNPPEKYKLSPVRSNGSPRKSGIRTFWNDVFPFLESSNKRIYFFAGDLGAFSTISSYYEDHVGKLHFYATGMGSGKEDNYLVVEIQGDKTFVSQRYF